ncbi:hypothetical protein M404DRAFT_169661, partial [Pisolithus tinctorius Marx 270]
MQQSNHSSCKNSLVSISPPVSTLSTPCCLGLQIDSWPGTPTVLITANFPWLCTRDGPDKLPFQVELIDGVIFVHVENCFRFSNVPELSVCLACDALAPKVTALAELARDWNKYTRHSLLTLMQLLEVAKNLDDQANTLKLQGLNDARKIKRMLSSLEDHTSLVMALSDHDVPWLRQLLQTSLHNGTSIRTILRMIEDALERSYRPKNHGMDAIDLALLVYRLGGANLLFMLNQRLALPSLHTLRCHVLFTKVLPTIGRILSTTVETNIKTVLHSSWDSACHGCRGVSLLIDETALEEAAIYMSDANGVGRLCWLHSHVIDPSLHTYQSALNIAHALQEGHVHLAKEVTVVGLHLFGKDTVYPILAAPTCKSEDARDMETVLTLVTNAYKDTGSPAIIGPLWSVATDGDALRHKAGHKLFVKNKIPISSDLFRILSNLPGLNMFTGNDMVTLDFDFKHVFKRFCMLLRGRSGLYLDNGRCINTFLLERYLPWVKGMDDDTVTRLLYPNNPQDVPHAIELMTALIKLGNITQPHDLDINTAADVDALHFLSQVLWCLVDPYINIRLSLSEQVVHLSCFAHLLYASYRNQRRRLMPHQLYYDLQTMVKAVVINIAKQQKLN